MLNSKKANAYYTRYFFSEFMQSKVRGACYTQIKVSRG